MSIATLAPLALKISLMLMVFSFGLKASPSDATYLFRHPGQLLRSLVSMDVVVPLIAVGLAMGFNLEPAVKIALVTIAIAPLPPVFFKKPLKAGGTMSYTVGLFVAATIVAVFFIPLALVLLQKLTGFSLQMPMAAVWKLVFTSLLVPLVLGIIIRRLAASLAERASYPILLTGSILLLASFIPILFKVWPAIVSLIGNGTIVVMIALAVVGLASGHLLGGPDPDDRVVLALASATRHPGIAIAIAQANFPDQKLAPAAILLYMLVSGIASAPYLKWTARQRPPVPTVGSPQSATSHGP